MTSWPPSAEIATAPAVEIDVVALGAGERGPPSATMVAVRPWHWAGAADALSWTANGRQAASGSGVSSNVLIARSSASVSAWHLVPASAAVRAASRPGPADQRVVPGPGP